jgi:hypothetical protein
VCSGKDKKINVYEGFTIAEPLLLMGFDSLTYLKAKRVAENFRLSAAETSELLESARGTDKSVDGKLEEAARKIRRGFGRRQQKRSRSR